MAWLFFVFVLGEALLNWPAFLSVFGVIGILFGIVPYFEAVFKALREFEGRAFDR